MTMFENLREDRRNEREDLFNALSSGKISEETVKEILQHYDSKYLEICERLSNADINKYYETKIKEQEIISKSRVEEFKINLEFNNKPRSFGESICDFADSFARGAEAISSIQNNTKE